MDWEPVPVCTGTGSDFLTSPWSTKPKETMEVSGEALGRQNSALTATDCDGKLDIFGGTQSVQAAAVLALECPHIRRQVFCASLVCL